MEKYTDLVFLPRTKDGLPDRRFEISFQRILNEAGTESIDELRQFAKDTENIQRKAAKAGMSLAVAIFNEANYLEVNHRFDPDNQYGWRSKSLRKQAQLILENIGFKQKNAHKLLACASWITSRSLDKSEAEWVDGLSPSHIYELSRMSEEGFAMAKAEVSYPEFRFSAGQQEISVRRLEELRRLYPKAGIVDFIKTNSLPNHIGREKSSDGCAYDEKQMIDIVPEFCYTSTTLPATNSVQDGIQMLIRSLGMIGSLDELSMSPQNLEKLRPHCMTLEILTAMLQTKTTSRQ